MLAMKPTIAVTWNDPSTDSQVRRYGGDETIYALQGFSYSALAAYPLEALTGLKTWSVLVNRLFAQSEMNHLEQLLQDLSATDVTHVYFADPAVYQLTPKALRSRLIYRSMTLVTSLADAQWWADQGIAFVSLSPIVTLEEIAKMIRGCPKAEVTVHGHLLQSVSKRKLLSAYGRYAGISHAFTTADDLAIMETNRHERFPIYEQEEGTLIYTDFVQESFADIASFAEMGAGRFFVESAFVQPDEILEALSIYDSLLRGIAGDAEGFRKRHADTHYSRGYYGQKTIF